MAIRIGAAALLAALLSHDRAKGCEPGSPRAKVAFAVAIDEGLGTRNTGRQVGCPGLCRALDRLEREMGSLRTGDALRIYSFGSGGVTLLMEARDIDDPATEVAAAMGRVQIHPGVPGRLSDVFAEHERGLERAEETAPLTVVVSDRSAAGTPGAGSNDRSLDLLIAHPKATSAGFILLSAPAGFHIIGEPPGEPAPYGSLEEAFEALAPGEGGPVSTVQRKERDRAPAPEGTREPGSPQGQWEGRGVASSMNPATVMGLVGRENRSALRKGLALGLLLGFAAESAVVALLLTPSLRRRWRGEARGRTRPLQRETREAEGAPARLGAAHGKALCLAVGLSLILSGGTAWAQSAEEICSAQTGGCDDTRSCSLDCITAPNGVHAVNPILQAMNDANATAELEVWSLTLRRWPAGGEPETLYDFVSPLAGPGDPPGAKFEGVLYPIGCLSPDSCPGQCGSSDECLQLSLDRCSPVPGCQSRDCLHVGPESPGVPYKPSAPIRPGCALEFWVVLPWPDVCRPRVDPGDRVSVAVEVRSDAASIRTRPCFDWFFDPCGDGSGNPTCDPSKPGNRCDGHCWRCNPVAPAGTLHDISTCPAFWIQGSYCSSPDVIPSAGGSRSRQPLFGYLLPLLAAGTIRATRHTRRTRRIRA